MLFKVYSALTVSTMVLSSARAGYTTEDYDLLAQKFDEMLNGDGNVGINLAQTGSESLLNSSSETNNLLDSSDDYAQIKADITAEVMDMLEAQTVASEDGVDQNQIP